MDIVTYKLSQKYADKVAAGFSSVRVDGLNIIFTLSTTTDSKQNIFFISVSKVDSLHSPKRITINWHKPLQLVMLY